MSHWEEGQKSAKFHVLFEWSQTHSYNEHFFDGLVMIVTTKYDFNFGIGNIVHYFLNLLYLRNTNINNKHL
jgi:hypothetical protein